MKSSVLPKLRQGLAAVALLLLTSLSAQAEPFFFNKDMNMVLDKATGLVWQTCSVGQTWDGKTCAGQAKTFNFFEAQNLTKDGWRVPTIRELYSLIYCSTWQTKDRVDLQDGGPAIPNLCVGNYSKPTINTTAFPQTPPTGFWSSSPYVGNSSNAWYVSFNGGLVNDLSRNDYYGRVRLVRASQSLGSEADLEFPISMSEITRLLEAKRQEEQRIAEAKRQEEQRIAEAKRQEEQRIAEAEARRAKAQRAAAERSLIAGGAQALYLQAGRAQRSGSVTVGGVSFNASELYEMVVEKFPKSEYAVKASDQLNAMDRTERQSSAVRDAANRAADAQRDADRNASNRAACFSEVKTCEAKCTYSDSQSYREFCVRNCQRSCN
jgi:hypothetical protein